MVRIRLARGGMKKIPFYHIIVTDSRNPRDGRFIERVGFFNPVILDQNKELYLNFNRIQYWISKGAQLSNRVAVLIKKNKNYFINI